MIRATGDAGCSGIIGGVSRRHEPPPGEFRYEIPLDVRFRDTDALGHVNNAVYLTYFEAARAGYYRAVTGSTFGFGAGAAGHTFVVAEARVVFRAPAYFGETLDIGCRVCWASRSSFGVDYRIRARESEIGGARLVGDGVTIQVMFDFATGRVSRIPRDLLEMLAAFEGHPIPPRSSNAPTSGG